MLCAGEGSHQLLICFFVLSSSHTVLQSSDSKKLYAHVKRINLASASGGLPQDPGNHITAVAHWKVIIQDEMKLEKHSKT